MEWEQILEYGVRANKTKDVNKAIELYDEAISLCLQYAEQAETEENRLTGVGTARATEATKYAILTNKIFEKADSSSGSERVEYFREAASYRLLAYSPRKEAAEIYKEAGYIVLYHGSIGIAYEDLAFHNIFLAYASLVDENRGEALFRFKESLSLLETALEHYNKVSRMEFHQDVELIRKRCIEYIEVCRHSIRKMKSLATDLKTTGTPSLSVDVAADNLRQNTYSRVLLRIVNEGDGVAKDVKIRLEAPVEGETAASLETMKEEYETELALSVKPLPHGRMKFKIYAEYMDMQGRKDAAIGEAWMQVARLTEEPVGQQVFHIANFTGEIGWDKQVAGGRTR